MASINYKPGTPEVTKVVTPAIPASVTLELSVDEAARIVAMLGQGADMAGTYLVYEQLMELLKLVPEAPRYVVANCINIPAIYLIREN